MKNINRDSLQILALILKSGKRTASIYSFTLDRVVREITLKNQTFRLTDSALEVLNQYGLNPNGEISMSKMRTLNKKLKSLGYKSVKSPLMLEHWNPIKNMINDLKNMNLSDKEDEAINQINEYFITQTNCFFKLTEKEWNLQPQKV